MRKTISRYFVWTIYEDTIVSELLLALGSNCVFDLHAIKEGIVCRRRFIRRNMILQESITYGIKMFKIGN